MKKELKQLLEESDNNTDLIIEFLKMILERLDTIITQIKN